MAELASFLGNILPRAAAARFWSWARLLNRHHDLAALNRALTLESDPERGWGAFTDLIDQLGNPYSTSASDLFLYRLPGRLLERIFGRVRLGPAAKVTIATTTAETLVDGVKYLAESHNRRASTEGHSNRANRCLAISASLAGEGVHSSTATAEPDWDPADLTGCLTRCRPMLQNGAFKSPLNTILWARRFLSAGALDAAEECMAWASSYIPEEPEVWALSGSIADCRGRTDRARTCFERALALDPQQLDAFMARQRLDGYIGPRKPASRELSITIPDTIELGARVDVDCCMAGGDSRWRLHILPPTGWGLVPDPASIDLDESGSARITLEACRADRINGSPWRLLFVVLGPSGHVIREVEVKVPDHGVGRILVTITEDHEIHEERGRLSVDLLRRLLVEKSRRAATSGPQWTHMVETGSTLALLDEAAGSEPKWAALRDEVRRHLVDEVVRGNDLQPHLHAFNDPVYDHFPYRILNDSLEPSLRFLLTPAEARGDWASACPPPGVTGGGRLDRIASVERSVAQVENLGRLGNPNFRAVLWRSGLLEYGDSPAQRSWSAVALRRSGLFAVSDVAKPRSSLHSALPAFYCDWDEPTRPHQAGPLLQLPIAANLEGDYPMGRRLLRHRALKSTRALRGKQGAPRAGVHLFTLLTHDKFINARFGRDEFCFDRDCCDWPVIRRHVGAWEEAGATFVTARSGVKQVIDDSSLRPVGILEEETFVAVPGEESRVRYLVTSLGRGIPFSSTFQQHLLVAVPPSLRPVLQTVEVSQSGRPLAFELEPRAGHFWFVMQNKNEPVHCSFRLRTAPGPRLVSLRSQGKSSWVAELLSTVPHRRARVLLPWIETLPAKPGARWSVAHSGPAHPLCEPHDDGLLISEISLDDARDPSRMVTLTITASTPEGHASDDVS